MSSFEMTIEEEIRYSLEQYLGECTCISPDELKIKILEATSDILSVVISHVKAIERSTT